MKKDRIWDAALIGSDPALVDLEGFGAQPGENRPCEISFSYVVQGLV